ncbi:MAG: TatD family hydrolase [Flavobacteriaceae bacterium]|nr:TatD family hydrolase [Flavobacteriaceae bacterium]
MIITDTHAHLYSEAFDEDRDAMVARAMQAGVERFFIPAIDSNYTQAMHDLEAAYPENMFLMMGLHPTHVKPETCAKEISHVEAQLAARKYWAVGEIGVDLYWDKSTLALQQEAFGRQIELAKQYNLPIAIHCRDAFEEVFEVLEAHKGESLHGVFHCFTGDKDQAMRAISYNLKLGIGGVVTFKNGKIDRFLSDIDLEHIVVETDAPYLSPTPYRGKRNESMYLIQVLEKLASIYDCTPGEIAEITTANSVQVFKI